VYQDRHGVKVGVGISAKEKAVGIDGDRGEGGKHADQQGGGTDTFPPKCTQRYARVDGLRGRKGLIRRVVDEFQNACADLVFGDGIFAELQDSKAALVSQALMAGLNGHRFLSDAWRQLLCEQARERFREAAFLHKRCELLLHFCLHVAPAPRLKAATLQ